VFLGKNTLLFLFKSSVFWQKWFVLKKACGQDYVFLAKRVVLFLVGKVTVHRKNGLSSELLLFSIFL